MKPATSNLSCSWGLPRHNKITLRGKSGRGLGLGNLSNIWGSPLIFLQWQSCPLSVSAVSCWFRLQSDSILQITTTAELLQRFAKNVRSFNKRKAI